MKTTVLITGLLLIVLANFMALYYAPYGREYFQDANANAVNATATSRRPPPAAPAPVRTTVRMKARPSGDRSPPAFAFDSPPSQPVNATNIMRNKVEGFRSMSLDSAAGANTLYSPMGQFDGVKLSTGNSVSGWRYTAPNEPLTGSEFVPGQDALFMFKNNQCKPECCGASFSCGGGCVCTTPQQRQYIAARGGNRTEPEDSA